MIGSMAASGAAFGAAARAPGGLTHRSEPKRPRFLPTRDRAAVVLSDGSPSGLASIR